MMRGKRKLDDGNREEQPESKSRSRIIGKETEHNIDHHSDRPYRNKDDWRKDESSRLDKSRGYDDDENVEHEAEFTVKLLNHIVKVGGMLGITKSMEGTRGAVRMMEKSAKEMKKRIRNIEGTEEGRKKREEVKIMRGTNKWIISRELDKKIIGPVREKGTKMTNVMMIGLGVETNYARLLESHYSW